MCLIRFRIRNYLFAFGTEIILNKLIVSQQKINYYLIL
jgi:hypothetical protein